jgi:ribosomal protein S9
MGVIHKIGRRKTAVARVYVSEGVITVNKKEFATYFPTATLQYKVQPMSMTENATNFDKSKCLWRWFNWTSRSCKNGISTRYV